MTKAGRHVPSQRYSPRTSHGAMAPPIDDPLSNNATAQPLSDSGNHSDTALVAPGQFAASPAPSRNRKNAKLFSPAAMDVVTATTEYHATASESPRRVPSRSSSRPDSS